MLIIDPLLPLIGAVLVGLCVGSFLNVVIHRLPIMLEREWQDEYALANTTTPPQTPRYNLMTPGSACPHCQRPIRFYENIPLLSWLLLKGRCAGCATKISARYPAVELLGAFLAAAAIWRFGPTTQGLAASVFLWALLALTFIDADTMLLPDSITLPLLWGGLLVNYDAAGFALLPNAVAGAMIGYLSLWSLYWLFKLIRGKEGMGYGDFKLFAALGAWLGATSLLAIIIFAAVAGTIVGGLFIILSRRDGAKPIPFGPYLTIGGAVVLLAKPWLPASLFPFG